jgi:hypothetical protein
MRLYRIICWVQGFYSLVTGVWPLVSIYTFQLVTGPKTDHLVSGDESDHWLVNTVGVLVTANATVLLMAAWRGRFSIEAATLGICSALGLTCIDIIYYSRGTISAVYLADAGLEVLFIVAWFTCLWWL